MDPTFGESWVEEVVLEVLRGFHIVSDRPKQIYVIVNGRLYDEYEYLLLTLPRDEQILHLSSWGREGLRWCWEAVYSGCTATPRLRIEDRSRSLVLWLLDFLVGRGDAMNEYDVAYHRCVQPIAVAIGINISI